MIDSTPQMFDTGPARVDETVAYLYGHELELERVIVVPGRLDTIRAAQAEPIRWESTFKPSAMVPSIRTIHYDLIGATSLPWPGTGPTRRNRRVGVFVRRPE